MLSDSAQAASLFLATILLVVKYEDSMSEDFYFVTISHAVFNYLY